MIAGKYDISWLALGIYYTREILKPMYLKMPEEPQGKPCRYPDEFLEYERR